MDIRFSMLCVGRHAGVYTAEEVALITREKLIRLQSLYIDQFKRLQHLLKEKKRRYLHNRKMEHEAIGNHRTNLCFYCSLLILSDTNLLMLITGTSLLTGPEGLSMKERENLKKLKALRRYRRRYGVEALLHRQLRERRQAVTEGGPQVLTWIDTEFKEICTFSLLIFSGSRVIEG